MTDLNSDVDRNELPSSDRPAWRKVVAFPLVSLAIALAAVIGVILAMGWLLQFIDPEPFGETGAMALSTFAVVIALYILNKLLLRHLGEFPHDDLPTDGALRDTGLGFLGGGWLMTIIVGVAFVLGAYTIEGWGTSQSAPMLLLQAGVFAGFVEELITRGIIFRFLEEFAGSWAALAISALIFGFAHATNPNATLFSSIAIAIEAGLLLGAAYMFTRNLWLAIGIHAGWNVVQGYIWDVPVSGFAVDGLVQSARYGNDLLTGGSFGLEGSIIALVIATIAGLWLLREAVRKGHVMKPWWTRRRLAREVEASRT